MRALSATLEAAPQNPTRAPVVSVRVEDRPPLADRLVWEELYSPGPAVRRSSDAAAFGDGRLARIANDSAGNIWVCVDPCQGAGPNWVWLTNGAATTGDSVAVTAYGSTAHFFWVASDGRTVYSREGYNYLANWYAVTNPFTAWAGAAVRAIAAAMLDPTTPVVAVAVDPFTGNPDDLIRIVYRSAGVWVNTANSPSRYNDVVGLALATRFPTAQDYEIFVLITDYTAATGSKLAGALYTVASGWVQSRDLIPAAAASGVEYRSPSLIYSPVDGKERWLVGYVEYYSVTPADERPMFYWSINVLSQVGLPSPHPCGDHTGWPMHFVRTASYWYLLGYDRAWRAPAYTNQYLADLGPDLLAFALAQDEGKPGKLTLTLDDSEGKYLAAGVPGTAFTPLRQHSQVILGLGYHTAADDELSFDADWWITSTRQEQYKAGGKRGTAALVVECTDTLGWLQTQAATYTTIWQGWDVSGVLWAILSLAVAASTQPADARLARIVANLVVDVGDKFVDAGLRLIHEGGYTLRFPSAQTGTGGPGALICEILDAFAWPASAHAIGGPGQLPILAAEELVTPPMPNRLEVYSPDAPVYHGDAFDWDAIAAGYHIPVKYTSLQATDATAAEDVADRLMAWYRHAKRRAEVTVPYPVGLEIGDGVTLTDSWLAPVAVNRWVRGLRGHFQRNPARYDLTVRLEGAT